MQSSAAELYCHILDGEYPAQLRTSKSQVPFAPSLEGVVEIRVDSYKSIRPAGLRYINHWFLTYLLFNSAHLEMSYCSDVDNRLSHKE